MSMQLDSTDVKIIEMLQHDGRVMYKDIAQKAGVSLPTVRVRIQKLMELGVIKKFTVIIDSDKIVGKVRAMLLVQAEPSHIEEAVEKLSAMKEVREVYTVAGSNPIVVRVETRDMIELGEIGSKKLSKIEGVIGYSTLIITRTAKEEYGGSVEINSMVQFKCDFCHAPILGKPHIEYIKGGKYYFNAEECAKAYQNKKVEKEADLQQAT